MPSAVSLFSGCGGSDRGLIDAGFDVVMANDILPYARDVYLANLPKTDYRLCDVSEITRFPKTDLLAGCYPCQGFSQGGARDWKRSINFLYREFDRALRAIKPKAFVVENVPGMRHDNNVALLKNQIVRFRLAGYKVSWKELDAKDYGVPQDRRRILIVGIRSNLDVDYQFPEPTHGPGRLKPYRTQRDVIGRMPLWPESEFWDDDFHWYYLSRNRRRDWDEPSKTIVSHPRHMPLHPSSPPLKRLSEDKWRFSSKGKARRFSYHEAAQLQGFPRGMKFPDTASMRMKYRVIGNAVPPPLFNAVVNAMSDIW